MAHDLPDAGILPTVRADRAEAWPGLLPHGQPRLFCRGGALWLDVARVTPLQAALLAAQACAEGHAVLDGAEGLCRDLRLTAAGEAALGVPKGAAIDAFRGILALAGRAAGLAGLYIESDPEGREFILLEVEP